MFFFKRKKENSQKLENIMQKLTYIERRLHQLHEQNREENDAIIKKKLEQVNQILMKDKQKSTKEHADPLLPHLASIEKQITHLSKKINHSYSIPSDSDPIIIIENVHIENIVVDKMEYANNIGQLGVRELSGRLNIGTSHEGRTPQFLNKQKEMDEKNKKVQIRARKDNEEEK